MVAQFVLMLALRTARRGVYVECCTCLGAIGVLLFKATKVADEESPVFEVDGTALLHTTGEPTSARKAAHEGGTSLRAPSSMSSERDAADLFNEMFPTGRSAAHCVRPFHNL